MRTDSGMGYFRLNVDGLRRKMRGESGRYRAGDETVRLDFLGIMGGALAVKAEAARLESRERGYLVKSEITKSLNLDQLTSVTSLGRFIMDQTMLQGMNQALRALDTGNFTRWQGQIVSQLATSVPAWANTFVQHEASKLQFKRGLNDPDPGTSLANIIQYKRGEFDDLPVVRDIWGRPAKQTPEGQDPLIYHMFDLRKPQQVTDATRVLLFKLFENTGDADVIPSWPSQTITLPNKDRLTLPNKLYDSYVETVQGAKLAGFTKLATDRRWHAMNPADAVDLLKREYTKRSTVAKRQWIVQNAPELIEEYKKLLRQEGR